MSSSFPDARYDSDLFGTGRCQFNQLLSGAVYPPFLIKKRHTYFNAALLLFMN